MWQVTIYLVHGPQIIFTPITSPQNIFGKSSTSYQIHLDEIFPLSQEKVAQPQNCITFNYFCETLPIESGALLGAVCDNFTGFACWEDFILSKFQN